jgi:hypothetical protein
MFEICLYAQRPIGEYRNSIYKINATGAGGSKSSTGFVFEYKGKKGILVTLHSLCGCKEYSATKYNINSEGAPTATENNDVFAGFKITQMDLERDIAFIASMQFNPGPNFNNPKPDRGNVELTGFGFINNLLQSTRLSLDKLNSGTISLESLFKSYDIDKIESPIMKSKILVIENNSMIRPGWSGGPIIIRTNDELYGVINGGLLKKKAIPIVFGFRLADLNLKPYDKGSFDKVCNEYSMLFYSGSEEERDKQIESKTDFIVKKFQTYYKYLYARPSGVKDTPQYIILKTDSISISSPNIPFVEFSKKLKRQCPEEKIYVQLASISDEEGQLELVVKVGNEPILLPYSRKNSDGMRSWELKNYLVKSLKCKEWYKLVYLSLVAEQISNNEVKVVLYDVDPKSKNHIRKSYISYPEATNKDLELPPLRE